MTSLHSNFLFLVRGTLISVVLMLSVTIATSQVPTNTESRPCVNNLLEEDFSATTPVGWEGDFMLVMPPLQEGWILQSGASPDAPSTGADGAASGDYYLYLETNGPSPTMSVNTINTPAIELTDVHPSLRFNVLMNGTGIGHLKVNVLSGPGFGTSENVLTLTGPQHASSDVSNWEEAFVSLSQYEGQTIKVAFEGMKLTNNQGDIAIDLVQVCSEVFVPTLGEWAIICLGLMLLILGIVRIRAFANDELLGSA